MHIAIVTGGRSDRATLEVVFEALSADHDVRWIDVEPGIAVPHRSDAVSVAAIAATTVAGDLAGFPTDLVVVLGDRYEALGAAVGASIMGRPIAHLSGGDVTQGSQDDAYRHAISKLAHLHFPSNYEAADRLIQMGEEPSRVHMVGYPNLDRLARTKLMDRTQVSACLGLPRGHRWLLVSVHPDTLGDTAQAWEAIHEALNGIGDGISVVLLGPNRDAGHDQIEATWRERVAAKPDIFHYYPKLESFDFLSLLSHAEILIGNSSVGFYEAPSMAIPVINVGDRQTGRIPSSLCHSVEPKAEVILTLIELILAGKVRPQLPVRNPYGDGNASRRIADVVNGIGDARQLVRKRFYRLGTGPSSQAMGNVSE